MTKTQIQEEGLFPNDGDSQTLTKQQVEEVKADLEKWVIQKYEKNSN